MSTRAEMIEDARRDAAEDADRARAFAWRDRLTEEDGNPGPWCDECHVFGAHEDCPNAAEEDEADV